MSFSFHRRSPDFDDDEEETLPRDSVSPVVAGEFFPRPITLTRGLSAPADMAGSPCSSSFGRRDRTNPVDSISSTDRILAISQTIDESFEDGGYDSSGDELIEEPRSRNYSDGSGDSRLRDCDVDSYRKPERRRRSVGDILSSGGDVRGDVDNNSSNSFRSSGRVRVSSLPESNVLRNRLKLGLIVPPPTPNSSPTKAGGDFHFFASPKNYDSNSGNLDDQDDANLFSVSATSSTDDFSCWYIIGADNPYKITWDVLLFLISIFGFYQTHTNIKSRHHEFTASNGLNIMIEVFFIIDILLSFITEHKTSSGTVTGDPKQVAWKYLTTWFIFDAISLIPWESILVAPVIEEQNRRRWFKKGFFRTKGVVKVTRVLRGRHFKMFGKLANQTRRIGMGSKKLLRTLIKYIPKYILFFKKMKYVIALKFIRTFHVVRKVWKDYTVSAGENLIEVRAEAQIRARRLSIAVRNALNRFEVEQEKDSAHSLRIIEEEEIQESDEEGDDGLDCTEPLRIMRKHSEGTATTRSPPPILRRRHSVL